MKTINRFAFVALLLGALTFTTACEKEDVDNPDTTEALTEEEAVVLVEASLATETEGLAAETMVAVSVTTDEANSTPIPCGETQDSTYTFSRNGDYFTANYLTTLSWTPFCSNAGFLQSMSVSRTTDGSYSGNRISSVDSSTGTLTISNILTGTAYVIDGTFTRSGSQTIEAMETRSVTTETEFELADLNVNKGSRRIESGTATFTITGENAQMQTFVIEGTVIFLGNGAATVIINGNQYSIDL